jgi:hypothetical protein
MLEPIRHVRLKGLFRHDDRVHAQQPVSAAGEIVRTPSATAPSFQAALATIVVERAFDLLAILFFLALLLPYKFDRNFRRRLRGPRGV